MFDTLISLAFEERTFKVSRPGSLTALRTTVKSKFSLLARYSLEYIDPAGDKIAVCEEADYTRFFQHWWTRTPKIFIGNEDEQTLSFSHFSKYTDAVREQLQSIGRVTPGFSPVETFKDPDMDGGTVSDGFRRPTDRIFELLVLRCVYNAQKAFLQNMIDGESNFPLFKSLSRKSPPKLQKLIFLPNAPSEKRNLHRDSCNSFSLSTKPTISCSFNNRPSLKSNFDSFARSETTRRYDRQLSVKSAQLASQTFSFGNRYQEAKLAFRKASGSPISSNNRFSIEPLNVEVVSHSLSRNPLNQKAELTINLRKTDDHIWPRIPLYLVSLKEEPKDLQIEVPLIPKFGQDSRSFLVTVFYDAPIEAISGASCTLRFEIKGVNHNRRKIYRSGCLEVRIDADQRQTDG